MGRRRSCEKEINEGTWSKEEDEVLFNYVTLHGEGNWREVAQRSGLKRHGKSCRYRYINYLKPNIKRGDISKDEHDMIARLHHKFGNRWASIAKRFPGRTDIEIKNYWKIHLAKKLQHQHKPQEKMATIMENDVVIGSSNIQTEEDDDDNDDDIDNYALDDDFFLNNIIVKNDENGNIVYDLMMKDEKVKSRDGLKGAWSKKEDEILFNYVALHGEGQWNMVAQRTGLKRCGKSCRHRYLHYLKPGIKRGNISKEEEDMIIKLHHLYGNRWTLIAKMLPGRTDSEIKNHWHAYLSKRLQVQPKLPPSPKHYQHKLEEQIINTVLATELHSPPISTDPKNLEENIMGISNFDDNTDMDSWSLSQIEYDNAFLDDFLLDIFQNDPIEDDLSSKTPQIEYHNNMMGSSSSSSLSSIDHQCQFSEDDLDFWTSSEFPFFDL